VLDTLSPTVDKMVRLSDRSLYILSNYVNRDIENPAIFSLEEFDGYYRALTEEDSDEYALYSDVVRFLQSELYYEEIESPAVTLLTNIWGNNQNGGTLVNNQWTKIPYNVVVNDLKSEYDTGTYFFTPAAAGSYLFECALVTNPTTAWSTYTEFIMLALCDAQGAYLKALDRIYPYSAGSSVYTFVAGSTKVFLDAEVPVCFSIYQNSGSDLTIYTTSPDGVKGTYFSVTQFAPEYHTHED
jgi:hypothetical protein